MKLFPSFLIKQLYTRKSLERHENGFTFHIKNRLKDAQLTEVKGIRINKRLVSLEKVYVLDEDERKVYAKEINEGNIVDFPLRKTLTVFIGSENRDSIPEQDSYNIEISFRSSPFGWLDLKFEDKPGAPAEKQEDDRVIPRHPEDDYQEQMIAKRRKFLADFTGKEPQHLARPTYDPQLLEGNCEHFVGVAQVPLGIAGPIQVNGTYAQGSFLVPLATTEGTLVASYNRGMKLLNKCGGVQCTFQEEAMQRAPCFVMANGREGVKFRQWLQDNLEEIRKHAESTTSYGKLLNIETYLVGKFVYTRFNYSTGDAAGQNMVTLATYTACNWIVQTNPAVLKWALESNMATDKKPSLLNMLHTRGKRVTAEVVLKKEVLEEEFRANPEQLNYVKRIGEIGSYLSGSLNNSLHAANALAAMFIATGQDVANVAESCMGIGYSELTPEGDLYVSITLPSLIVATYGGGTGLPAQREWLEMMDCYGAGKAKKFAEIVTGVVLAGELSLGMAIVSLEWVSSHEAYGRNR
jgi:hydroxymethylglutaryl-CoA reductase (NADPH)